MYTSSYATLWLMVTMFRLSLFHGLPTLALFVLVCRPPTYIQHMAGDRIKIPVGSLPSFSTYSAPGFLASLADWGGLFDRPDHV